MFLLVCLILFIASGGLFALLTGGIRLAAIPLLPFYALIGSYKMTKSLDRKTRLLGYFIFILWVLVFIGLGLCVTLAL